MEAESGSVPEFVSIKTGGYIGSLLRCSRDPV
jgi:hypothetical protein